MDRKTTIILTVAIAAMVCTAGAVVMIMNSKHARVTDSDWYDGSKNAINSLLDMYGVDSKNPANSPYAVFDFDNTSQIFDVEELTSAYMIETMSFQIPRDKIRDVLSTGLEGDYSELIENIAASYDALLYEYGGDDQSFDQRGIEESKLEELHQDTQWKIFAADMGYLYEYILKNESIVVAYPWITYWFYGMTDLEIHDVTIRALTKYQGTETQEHTWNDPKETISYTWISGISITKSVKELWHVLMDNKIDVWVCSASSTEVVRAAIDFFGLHNECKGVLAMTPQYDKDGKITNQYNDNGYGFYTKSDGNWGKTKYPVKSITQGEGKSQAIRNALYPEYGNHGPIAGFMDSTGDFNFCTEFESLKLVICFNRADRDVTEGAGLVAEVAIYQEKTLGYNLKKANDAGDTLYVLQGRDENGMRSLRNSESTLKLGEQAEKLFKGVNNQTQLDKMIDDHMSTKEIFEKWSIKGAPGFDFDIGFLGEYQGYHCYK